MSSTSYRTLGCALLALLAGSTLALAQGVYVPPQNAPPPPGQTQVQNPVCARLEGQLAAFDRGMIDPARADQIHRYEDAVNKQQSELDRLVAQSRRTGCEGSGFFALFSGQPPQCGRINNQIQEMRSNLDRMMSDLQRLQSNGPDREGQRQSIIVALAQNNCGPQYRAAVNAQPRGLFGALFGGSSGPIMTPETMPDSQSSTYRTLCVRTCDGFYFPISFATTPARFHDDEQACQRMCPAAEVSLYTYRNPGEDVSQAVSLDGRPYTQLPNAFRYRQQFDAACSCRRAGQSWADALGGARDNTIERGDIIVTDQRSKALSQPKGAPAQSTAASPASSSSTPAAANANGNTGDASAAPGKRSVRTVGPPFLPVR
ncbi:MAG TPA: DUF2865 domain-containing protein [Xanthobacteraceae bacterium]|nr:DUF2865 domain-containing protein [Xanthobacteraceae bacterium]